MRRLIDLIETSLEEYQLAQSTGWEGIPSSKNSKPVGRVGAGVVKSEKDSQGESFWVEHDGVDIAFAAVDKIGDYLAMREAFVLPEFQGRAVMSDLAHWIIRVQGMKLINDIQMTAVGVKFWRGLMKSMIPSIIDIATGSQYKIDDANSPKPENDTASGFYDSKTGQGQRYFYMIEAPESFKHIVEGVEHIYHCDASRHLVGGRGYIPRYFDEGSV